jgi:hypothetical protein
MKLLEYGSKDVDTQIVGVFIFTKTNDPCEREKVEKKNYNFMKLKIIQCKEKKFQGDDGEEISYFWYVAREVATGMIKRFGSTDGLHEKDMEYDIDLEADISSKGKTILKEFIPES